MEGPKMEKSVQKANFATEDSRLSENALDKLGLFYVLSLSPSRRLRKQANPKKLG